jgi:phage terminase large subunit-like protein
MGEMRVMGRSGDTRIIWNPRDVDEVAAAKRTFDDLVGGKGFLAFRVNKESGNKGTQIREFDPQAEKLIIAPPMAGGAS